MYSIKLIQNQIILALKCQVTVQGNGVPLVQLCNGEFEWVEVDHLKTLPDRLDEFIVSGWLKYCSFPKPIRDGSASVLGFYYVTWEDAVAYCQYQPEFELPSQTLWQTIVEP